MSSDASEPKTKPEQVQCGGCWGTGRMDDGNDSDGRKVWIDCPWCQGTGLRDPLPPYVPKPPKRRSITR